MSQPTIVTPAAQAVSASDPTPAKIQQAILPVQPPVQAPVLSPVPLQPLPIQVAIDKRYIATKLESLTLRCTVGVAPLDISWHATHDGKPYLNFKIDLSNPAAEALSNLIPDGVAKALPEEFSIADYFPRVIRLFAPDASGDKPLFSLTMGKLSPNESSSVAQAPNVVKDFHLEIQETSSTLATGLSRQFEVKFHNVITAQQEMLQVATHIQGAMMHVTFSGREVAQFQSSSHGLSLSREYHISIASGLDMSLISGVGIAINHLLSSKTWLEEKEEEVTTEIVAAGGVAKSASKVKAKLKSWLSRSSAKKPIESPKLQSQKLKNEPPKPVPEGKLAQQPNTVAASKQQTPEQVRPVPVKPQVPEQLHTPASKTQGLETPHPPVVKPQIQGESQAPAAKPQAFEAPHPQPVKPPASEQYPPSIVPAKLVVPKPILGKVPPFKVTPIGGIRRGFSLRGRSNFVAFGGRK
jgi:hypothetical protein